jgi:hypothetical protein
LAPRAAETPSAIKDARKNAREVITYPLLTCAESARYLDRGGR